MSEVKLCGGAAAVEWCHGMKTINMCSKVIQDECGEIVGGCEDNQHVFKTDPR
jgi:hypothetical protein